MVMLCEEFGALFSECGTDNIVFACMAQVIKSLHHCLYASSSLIDIWVFKEPLFLEDQVQHTNANLCENTHWQDHYARG